MCSGTLRRLVVMLVLACAAGATACSDSGIFRKQYEYEEELYLRLDGSATAFVNASAAALVALRGADLDVNPRARIDREHVRAMFSGPGARVATPTFSRRDGRRFVHVRVDVDDVRELQRLAPFAWSTYRFDRQGDVLVYSQVVGRPSGKPVPNAGWKGNELVSFKMHLPSQIPYNNSRDPVQRGNILKWEQPLAGRLAGEPLNLEVHLEPTSILYTTLLLFGGTIIAAALTFAVVIWWVARRGRDAEMAESRP